MKLLLVILPYIALMQFSCANEQSIAGAKLHLSNILKTNFTALEKSYASSVTLMPGHEFLKQKHGLAKDGRSKELIANKKKLIVAMKTASASRPARPVERIDKLLKSLKYELIKTGEGDFITDASDPVGTADGKLHFLIKKDDVLLRVSPPKGDFILLHLRKIDGVWKVVSEYLD
jgi:hypothetical protein